MFRRFFAALLAALSRLRAGAGAAYAFMHDAVEEAVEPVVSRLPWVRDRAVDTASLFGAGTLAAAQVPGALLREVGSVVSSFLPSPALTPQAVADHAVAQDSAPRRAPSRHTPPEEFDATEADAELVQAWARAYRTGDHKAADRLATIHPAVYEWIQTCTKEQLRAVESLPASRITAHLLAKTDSDRSILLPPAHGIPRLIGVPSADRVLARAGLTREERAWALAPEPEDNAGYAPAPRFA